MYFVKLVAHFGCPINCCPTIQHMDNIEPIFWGGILLFVRWFEIASGLLICAFVLKCRYTFNFWVPPNKETTASFVYLRRKTCLLMKSLILFFFLILRLENFDWENKFFFFLNLKKGRLFFFWVQKITIGDMNILCLAMFVSAGVTE